MQTKAYSRRWGAWAAEFFSSCAIVCFATTLPIAGAFDIDKIGLGVVGRFEFLHSASGVVNPKGLNVPLAIAIDTSVTPNRIFVADGSNSRVLGWTSATGFANGAAADLVIGQPDFLSSTCNTGGVSARSLCSPSGVAVDGAGNLYVADFGNNRVLEYIAPFNSGAIGGAAGVVFGQHGDFTKGFSVNCPAPAADTLCLPTRVAVDSANNLFVSDSYNNRVLEYNTPLKATGIPGSGDTKADMVFGQGGSFTSNASYNANAGSLGSLFVPSGLALDSVGNLFVADAGYDRVLEFNTPLMATATPGSGDAIADIVFGQAASFPASNGGCALPTFGTLCSPLGVALDGSRNLYVADTDNSRVLEYNTPLQTGHIYADRIFGQGGSFFSPACADGFESNPSPSANGLCLPRDVAADVAGNVYIADSSNNRVLGYNTPLQVTSTAGSGDTTADRVLGQHDFLHNGPNAGAAPEPFCYPKTDADSGRHHGRRGYRAARLFSQQRQHGSEQCKLERPEFARRSRDRHERGSQSPVRRRFHEQPRPRLGECSRVCKRCSRRAGDRSTGLPIFELRRCERQQSLQPKCCCGRWRRESLRSRQRQQSRARVRQSLYNRHRRRQGVRPG
jgi:sugar lactone lactonase YvrE